MSTPTSAVVVCAYTERRFDDLLDAVASARRQQPAPAEVVVVVDHNAELARRVREAVEPEVTVLENARRQGLSGARNTALDHLHGAASPVDGRVELRSAPSPEVVAFLDDDAAARDGWLAALLAPYADAGVAAVGGVAVPRWPGAGDGTPAVLPPELWWVVGCTYTGQHPDGAGATDTVEVRNLMGCSMSFRRSVFTAVGGFAEDMGRVGTIPLGCEETDLCLRLRAHDPVASIRLAPAAVVDHRVSDDRTGWRYLLRRSWAEGLSKAVLARAAGAGPALASERSYTARVLPAAVLRELRRGHGRSAAAVPAALAAAGGGYLRGRTARPAPPDAGAPLHQYTGRAALRSVPTADREGIAS